MLAFVIGKLEMLSNWKRECICLLQPSRGVCLLIGPNSLEQGLSLSWGFRTAI